MSTRVFALSIVVSIMGCNSANDAYPTAELDRVTALMRPSIVAAGTGPVAPLMRTHVAAAARDRVPVVLYIGATWCEPCTRFKQALKRRELDLVFAGVRFVEFDNDADEQRLKDAGYGGRFIPRFVVPTSDGRGSDLRTEGSVKGPGGVAHIAPRLRRILTGNRTR